MSDNEEDISDRLRSHVNNRGGPSITNGAWEMMLEAADEIDRLRGIIGRWQLNDEIRAAIEREPITLALRQGEPR